jgi:hypothetical protein
MTRIDLNLEKKTRITDLNQDKMTRITDLNQEKAEITDNPEQKTDIPDSIVSYSCHFVLV